MRAESETLNLDHRLAARARVAIIRAEYNAAITTSLEAACVNALRDAGISEQRIARFTVPGCFEIPVVAARIAKRRRHDVIIALGAVVRGDTYHFELVANECARGAMQVSLQYGVPVIFEVLAVYKLRDALRRAGRNRMNKGIEAAHA